MKSISIKISFFMVLFFMIASIFISLFTGRLILIEFQNNAFNELSIINDIKLEEYKEKISNFERNIVVIAKNELLLEHLSKELTNSEEIVLRLKKFVKDYAIFDEIFIYKNTGEIIYSSDSKRIGLNVNNEDFFENSLIRQNTQDIYYSNILLSPALTLTIPLVIKNQKYVLGSHANLKSINNIISSRTGQGNSGETFLLNKFNIVITDLLYSKDKAFSKVIFSDYANDCTERKNSGKTISEDYTGKMYLISYKWADDEEICIVTKKAREEVITPIYEIVMNMIISILLSMLILLIISVFIIKKIASDRILLLSQVVENLSKGKMSTVIDKKMLNSDDEIGTLAKSFDRILISLKLASAEIKMESKDKKDDDKITNIMKEDEN